MIVGTDFRYQSLILSYMGVRIDAPPCEHLCPKYGTMDCVQFS